MTCRQGQVQGSALQWHILLQPEVWSPVGPPDTLPSPPVLLRNKAGSAFQHNLFLISLSYGLFMITFNFNVYQFIFIMFPLGLFFPFVKICQPLQVRVSQYNLPGVAALPCPQLQAVHRPIDGAPRERT